MEPCLLAMRCAAHTHTRDGSHTTCATVHDTLLTLSAPLPFSYRLTVSTIRLTSHTTAATATHDSVSNDSAYTHTDGLTLSTDSAHKSRLARTSQDLLGTSHVASGEKQKKRRDELAHTTAHTELPPTAPHSFFSPLWSAATPLSLTQSSVLVCRFFGGHLAFARIDDVPATSSRHFPQPRQRQLSVVFVCFRRHTPFSPYVAPRFPHMSEIHSLFSHSPERPICSIAWRPDGQQARLENKHEKG